VEKPLTLNQLSICTGLPRAWLAAQANAGRLPCLRVGDVVLFNLSAVETSLARIAGATRSAERPEVDRA
jgi:hypothetical protein